MNFNKKTISLILIIALLIAIFMPSIVKAGTTIRQGNKIVNTTASETLIFDGKEHNSTVYAGEIKKDGVTVLTYLYSNDITRSSVVFDNLRKALSNPYSDMVPNVINEQAELGLKELSVTTLNDVDLTTITEGWTDASSIATQIYNGTNTDIVNNNMYDVDNGYKNEIDNNVTERAVIDNPIENNKRIISHLGTKNTDTVTFTVVEGQLIEVHDVDLIYLSEATTVIYTKVDVTTDSDIIRKTTTNYYTIVDGTFTITGDDSYSKSYKSGDKNKEEEYIAGNYTDEAVANEINEYTKDMSDIASDYRTTALINGEVSSYYYKAHDEITQDIETGKITINTILDKYQVYTLTGTAESNKITYTLDDEIGNQISFKDFEGIVFVFNSTDILNLTDEELQAIADDIEVDIEEINAMKAQMIEVAKNAISGKGTLVGLYDFSISDGIGLKEEATGGFKIRIKMTDEMKKYNDFSIACLKDDGSIEDLIKLTQNGEYLEGVIPHLSSYVVIGNNVEEAPINNPKTSDNIMTYVLMLGFSIVGITVIRKYKRK